MASALIICAIVLAATGVTTASAQALTHRAHPYRVHESSRGHKTRENHRRNKRKHTKKVKHHKAKHHKAKHHKLKHHKHRTVKQPATGTRTAVTPVSTVAPTPATPGPQSLSAIGLTSEAATSTDPSGAPMPTGNLPGWTQVFSDNFSTAVPLGGFSGCNVSTNIMHSNCTGLPSSVSSQLTAYGDGWSDTSGNGRYEASQVLSIHDHMLDYYLHTSGGTHMVAAVVPKIPGGVSNGGLKYGAYAVRFKSDNLPGYKSAFMLWPDSNRWPQDGEIDFPEGDLNSSMYAYMHDMGATSGSQQAAYATNTSYTSWHTAVIEWTPTQCTFILDGHVIGSSVNLIPNTPMHWVLQVETSLDGSAPSSSVAGHFDIAWITAYAQS